MRNKILGYAVCLSMIVSGCTTPVPPDTGLTTQVQAPPLPETLAQRANALPQTQITNSAELTTEYAQSIQAYNRVAHQTNNLITFYNCVKEVINNKTNNMEQCLEQN